MTFIKNLFKYKETKLITKPHIIKGRKMVVYLHNKEYYIEYIKDDVIFHEGLQANLLNREYDSVLYLRLQGDSVCINNGHIQVLIPKTSINRTELSPVEQFETVEIFDRYE